MKHHRVCTQFLSLKAHAKYPNKKTSFVRLSSPKSICSDREHLCQVTHDFRLRRKSCSAFQMIQLYVVTLTDNQQGNHDGNTTICSHYKLIRDVDMGCIAYEECYFILIEANKEIVEWFCVLLIYLRLVHVMAFACLNLICIFIAFLPYISDEMMSGLYLHDLFPVRSSLIDLCIISYIGLTCLFLEGCVLFTVTYGYA